MQLFTFFIGTGDQTVCIADSLLCKNPKQLFIQSSPDPSGNSIRMQIHGQLHIPLICSPFQMAVRIGISKDISRIFINEIWIFFQDSPNPFPKFSLCR